MDFIITNPGAGIVVIEEGDYEESDHNIEVYLKRVILDEFPHDSKYELIYKINGFHIYGII